MNRKQMVEKAAQASWDADTEAHGLSRAYGWQPPGGDELNDGYRKQARIMLDAILPQVSTVAELKALPMGSVLIDQQGHPYRPSDRGMVVSDRIGLVSATVPLRLGPLTVVWQPEVTS